MGPTSGKSRGSRLQSLKGREGVTGVFPRPGKEGLLLPTRNGTQVEI